MTERVESGGLSAGDYRTIFHNASDGMFVHPPNSDEILEVNERFAEMLGYSREQLLGRRISEITDDDWEPPVPAAERVRQARERGQATFEWRDQKRDGTAFWVEVSLTRVSLGGDDYVLASVRDISERKAQERRTRAIFDGTYQFTGLIEPDGTVIEANETALEFGGLDREDVIGKRVWNCDWFRCSEQSREQARSAVRRAADGEFVRQNLEVRGADGTEIIDFSIRPVTDDTGQVTLLIPEGRVITELLEQRERLDVYNRVMRHNIRNKLAVINGLTSEISEVTDDDDVAAYAERVLATADRIDGITEQIREFDRRRQQAERTQQVDVAALIEGVAAEYDVQTDVESGLTVASNGPLLRLVVEQLVENAVEHGAPPVRVAAGSPPGQRVEIRVDDDGPGIAPDEYEPVLARETTQLDHTTGIGLLVSRWCVDAVDGEIQFDCDGEGTTVCVRLPDGV